MLELVDGLYSEQKLRRVYYSGFIALGGDDRVPTPETYRAPLHREHRLYQADWLLRKYGFDLDEVAPPGTGNLDAEVDPKTAYALRFPSLFPVDVNAAPIEWLQRVPGLGLRSAHRIVAARRHSVVRWDDLRQMGVVLKRAQYFLTTPDHRPQLLDRDPIGRPCPARRWARGRGPAALAVRAAVRRRPVRPASRLMLPVDPALTVETDGTFAGLLAAYAEAHRCRALPAEVRTLGQPGPGALFAETVALATDVVLAERVERGLERAKPGLVGRLRRAFLSERPGMEVALLRLIDAVADWGAGAAEDWTFEPAREVTRWAGRVGREAHRMEAFVRFERIDAGWDDEAPETFVARIRPEYNVLPILHGHFETRYPTLAWRIVDVRRALALVHTPAPLRAPGQPPSEIVPVDALDLPDDRADGEDCYQRMWQAYFRAVTIPERRNLTLHLRHVPKRYWPYLTEKQG